jgi:hypothetical protein
MTDVEKIGWYILLSSVVDPKLFFRIRIRLAHEKKNIGLYLSCPQGSKNSPPKFKLQII